jgi:hypothetical protein
MKGKNPYKPASIGYIEVQPDLWAIIYMLGYIVEMHSMESAH